MVKINQLGLNEGSRVFRGADMRADMTMGLWNKQKFRAYVEFTSALNLKFAITKNFILTLQELHLDTGQAKVQIVVGATEGGVFAPISTKFCMNTVGGDVAGNCVISSGGTLTGGTEREVLRANSGAGAGADAGHGGVRVLPANTYQMRITVTGTTSGIYSLEWEELD